MCGAIYALSRARRSKLRVHLGHLGDQPWVAAIADTESSTPPDRTNVTAFAERR
jgi:hypothetical protein